MSTQNTKAEILVQAEAFSRMNGNELDLIPSRRELLDRASLSSHM